MHRFGWLVAAGICGLLVAGCEPDIKLVPLNGVNAQMEPTTLASQPAVKVTFLKEGDERRLLAVEVPAKGAEAGAKAMSLRYRLDLKKGVPPRLALTIYDRDGGVWYKVGGAAVVGEPAEGRISLGGLSQAQFSQGKGAELDWAKVRRVWVGLTMDGPAEGVIVLSDVRFTREPYRPTKPLRITGDGPGVWSVGKDPAVEATLTTPNEAPGGKACMKFEFKFPGGRHMYAIPSTPVPDAELDGYRALRFTYKAALPEGLKGLLVSLSEREGGQYYADPPPPASADWKTITIPFASLKFAPWSKDPNGRFDLGQVSRVSIGTHGTASGKGGPGVICVTDVEFIP